MSVNYNNAIIQANYKLLYRGNDIINNQQFFSKIKMKSSEKTIVLIIFVTIFAFSLLITVNFSYFKGYTPENLEFDVESNLKGADYWNLTGTPIFINDLDPNNNWNKTASENDWCSGNGSLSNPYIIENVTIDANSSSTGCGIHISNSQTEYFTIRNVTVYNAGSHLYDTGIKLENTNKGTLTNNNCSNNIGTGIYLENSNTNVLSGNNVSNNNGYGIYIVGNNNTISGNTVCNNTLFGIMLEGKFVDISTHPHFFYFASYNNIISGNTVNHNVYGIWVEDSHTNTISGNVANNNTWDGIMLWGILHHSYRTSYNNTVLGNTANNNNLRGIVCVGSNSNTFSGNTANNNKAGIHLYVSVANTLSGNTASYNTYEGIFLSQSNVNTISGNMVNNNTNGISLYESNRNTISGNILIGNNVCIVEDNCQGNTFSNNGACTYGQESVGIISGYNLFFLLGFLSVVVILMSKRRL